MEFWLNIVFIDITFLFSASIHWLRNSLLWDWLLILSVCKTVNHRLIFSWVKLVILLIKLINIVLCRSYHFGITNLIVFESLAWRGFSKWGKSHLVPIFKIRLWIIHIHHTKPQRLLWISLALTVPFSLLLDRREHPIVELLLWGAFLLKNIFCRILVLLCLLRLSVSFVVTVPQLEFKNLVDVLFGHGGLFWLGLFYVRLGFLFLFLDVFLYWSLRVASVEDLCLLFGLIMLELPELFINFAFQLFETLRAAPPQSKRILTALIHLINLFILEPRIYNRVLFLGQTCRRLIMSVRSRKWRIIFRR